jgi:ATP-dependent helicase Lhr and Lhr-like helicase
LSATARPLRLVAGFLAGSGRPCKSCILPNVAHPASKSNCRPIRSATWPARFTGSFCPSDCCSLAGRGDSMLVFCNTRGLVERVAALLAEQPGRGIRWQRITAASAVSVARPSKRASSRGQIKVVVCSSSLELGIDVGPLDRVCQIGSAGAINSMLQRAGRSRHRPGQTPQLHYFPLNLSDLLDGVALVEAMGQGRLDRSQLCPAPRDVLAQQLVAMVAAGTERDRRVLPPGHARDAVAQDHPGCASNP